jgi:methionyl-tRNA formyltransferase
VSQPDRPRGRGRKLEPTPVRLEAERHGLPLLQPEKVAEPDAVDWMQTLQPDLGCVTAFGQFIPKRVRELPSHGLINAHASLLPRHRGAAPIQHAILAGDSATGVTIIRVAREMDAGDWCLRRETAIGPEESAGELAERLARLAAELLVEAADAIADGTARFVPQASEGVTLAGKLDRDFGRINWGEPVPRVLRRIRAATPAPGAFTLLNPGERRLRILEARSASNETEPARPGRVRSDDERLRISALDGWVEVLRLQEVGRKPLEAAAYLRGARLTDLSNGTEELKAR